MPHGTSWRRSARDTAGWRLIGIKVHRIIVQVASEMYKVVSKCSGFTRIGLLAVIATIAILAAVLLPLFALTSRHSNTTSSADAAPEVLHSLAVYEPINFEPLVLDPRQANSFDLLVSEDLERTPRDYVRVTATLKASGTAKAMLVVVDVLGREHLTPVTDLPVGQDYELSLDIEQIGRPVSMLRAVKLFAHGQPIEVSNLQFVCAAEYLPKPDVIAKGPLDDTSIQAALDALGEDGGIVYIPAGTYIINNQIIIPTSNITIYGEGRDTVIQGVWLESKALIYAEGKENLRFTRLHLRSLPLDEFRGYNDPEDTGRPSVTSLGIMLQGCRQARIDHCEIELFGYAAVRLGRGSRELCVDHCFLHENFRAGYGYGVVPVATKEAYIEDNNFENHRHGVAGGRNSGASYTCRFNRFVKDTKAIPETSYSYQIISHEIDVHSGCSWLYAHDNWVEMKNGMMGAGASMRGNPAWLYRNVFVNCRTGIVCSGNSTDVWTWDNEFVNVNTPHSSSAKGDIYFGQKPYDFAEIPYPHPLNRLGWWPGADPDALGPARPETQYAGPETQVLHLVSR